MASREGTKQKESVEKIRQRRSRQIPVLTYKGYAPRLNLAAALLGRLFEPTQDSHVQDSCGLICPMENAIIQYSQKGDLRVE